MNNKSYVKVSDNQVQLTLANNEVINYPIKTNGKSSSAIKYFPIYADVIVMNVYTVRLYELLSKAEDSNLSTLALDSYVIGIRNDNTDLPIGTKVYIPDMNQGMFLPIEDNKYSAKAIRDFVRNTFPELTIGTAIALDKSRARVGLNTANDVIISTVSAKEIADRVKENKGKNNILSLFDPNEDTIQIVAFMVLEAYSCKLSIVD